MLRTSSELGLQLNWRDVGVVLFRLDATAFVSGTSGGLASFVLKI